MGSLPVASGQCNRDDLLMWIDIDEDEEPISGFLRGAGRADVHFHGWLQLASALERARQESEEAATDEPPEH